MRRALAILLTATLMPVATAAASDATRLGEGSLPGLAVDGAGTAYVAWTGPEPLSNTLQFCRVARGAPACSIRSALATTGNSVTRPFVTVSGARVIVAQYRYQEKEGDQQGIYAWTSADGGATFDGGRLIATTPFQEAVAGPGDTLSVVTDAFSGGEVFQNTSLAAGSGATIAAATLSADHPYNGTVGLLDASTPLEISATGSGAAQFRRYAGTGDLNDAANWTPAVEIGALSYPHLAGGPSGLFVEAGTGGRELIARKWNGSGFDAPVGIGGGDPPNAHLFQDAAGRLQAIYHRGDADGEHLVHAVSDDGAHWRVGTLLIQQVAADGGVGKPRIATAADHIGVAVWEAGAGVRDVRITPVGPDAPAPLLRASGKAKRRGGRVIVKVSGRLVPPSGLTKGQACGGGNVTIRLLRGKKKIDAHKVAVSSRCTFAETRKLKASKVKRARNLRMKIAFPGDNALAPARRGGKLKVR